jgi:hypothetical protein
MTEAERAKDIAREYIDDKFENIISHTIKKLIDMMTSWDDSGLWSRGYKALYAPQITVFSKLLATELKYDRNWVSLRDLRHEAARYNEEVDRIVKSIPDPAFGSHNPSENGRKLVKVMDQFLQGNINVMNTLSEKVAKINRILEIEKPRNIFDLVFGTEASYTARNDFCYEVKDFISTVEDLATKRNRWAATQRLLPARTNFKMGLERQCPDTAF